MSTFKTVQGLYRLLQCVRVFGRMLIQKHDESKNLCTGTAVQCIEKKMLGGGRAYILFWMSATIHVIIIQASGWLN